MSKVVTRESSISIKDKTIITTTFWGAKWHIVVVPSHVPTVASISNCPFHPFHCRPPDSSPHSNAAEHRLAPPEKHYD
jgi:hypothetical protein